MKLLALSKGLFSKVDDDTFEKFGGLAWTAQKRQYGYHAARYFGAQYIYLHQLILQAPSGSEVHHKNGDGLDNQRDNLVVVSRSFHRKADLRLLKNNTSGYRGVSFHKAARRWAAEIKEGGVKTYLGLFYNPKVAALVRDAKARELGWPESGMNFPK